MNQQTNMDKRQRLQLGILRINNKDYPIYEGVNTVGRNMEAIVNIKHLNISQNHAVVVVINGSHFISDLNSSNGTFVENSKNEPFKLYELKNDTKIKLGDLNGIYMTQGISSTNNYQSHMDMTQEVTQSFYGSNTQILGESKINNTETEIEDIHDAPTQEISWDAFKIPTAVKTGRKDNEVVKNKNNEIQLEIKDSQEDDIHNCATQVIEDVQSNKSDLLCDKNKKNSSTESNLPGKNSKIHDVCNTILPIVSNNLNDANSAMQGPEIFCPFNDETLPLHENNDIYVENDQISETDKATDIHDAVTQVINICEHLKPPVGDSNLDDDEATDCEDNTDLRLDNQEINTKSSDKQHISENTLNDNQSKLTNKGDTIHNIHNDGSNDSMEFFGLNGSSYMESKDNMNKTNELKSNIPCQVSKQDKNTKDCHSGLNIQTENSSDESFHFQKKKVCHLSSDSDTEDEGIGFKRKRKSTRVISTQDICEQKDDGFDSDSNSESSPKKKDMQESYVINDVDSEDSDTEINNKNMVFEESIPATQNESVADLNDTDCIPATQDVIKPLTSKSVVKPYMSINDDAKGSSEESFKLGLTELMDVPSQTVGFAGSSQDPCSSSNNKNPSPIFGTTCSKSTLSNDTIKNTNLDKKEHVTSIQEPSSDINKNSSPIFGQTSSKNNLFDDSDKTDIYIAVGQKTDNYKTKSNEDKKKHVKTTVTDQDNLHNSVNEDETQIDDIDNTDIYIASTQKIEINRENDIEENNKNIEDESTTDIYLAPTQKFTAKKLNGTEAKLSDKLDEDNGDIYIASTQKIGSQSIIDSRLKSAKENVSLKNVNSKDKHLKNDFNESECFYGLSTQKIETIETDHDINPKSPLDGTNTDIYLAPTQKVFNEATDTYHNSSKESMDDLYLQPTQQADDTFNQPTQKVQRSEDEKSHCKPTLIFEDTKNDNKKKFSFKKKSLNLDGSLTNILNRDTNSKSQSHSQREDTSSIEVEFLDTEISSDLEFKRPSNPLSHILENSAVSSEIPLTENILTDANNEEMTKQIRCGTGESKQLIDGNLIKTDKALLNDTVKFKKQINTTNLSNKDQNDAKLDVPKISIKRERLSIQSPMCKNSKSNIKPDLGKLEFQTTNNEKGHNSDNLDIKPKARRTTRRPSSSPPSSSSLGTNTKLDTDNIKLQISTDQTNNSLNATTSEVNQSVAFLESKIVRTRKTIKSEEIQVKVPKTRRSKGISEMEKLSESSDIEQKNITNVVPKRGRKKTKAHNDHNVTKQSQPSTSESDMKTEKRSRRGRRQSEESQLKDEISLKESKIKAINNNPRISKRNLLKSEMSKETGPDINLIDTNGNTEIKEPEPTCGKTRQVSKRKQLTEQKSDDDKSSTHSDNNLSTPKKHKPQSSKQADERKQLIEEKAEDVDSHVATPKKQRQSRQVGKRKQPTELKSDSSDTSISTIDSNLVTPKKQKLEASEALLNTKERALRKQKPKVVFTMLESPQLESMVKQLGGSMVDTVDACTVLVTEHVKRSQKLLSVVGLGKPICSPKWITDSKKAHEFLDPWDYILSDKEAETKWNFSLKESLNRSKNHNLLESYHFQILVTNAADVLKGAIESCGGKCISKIPSQSLENTFLISSPENQSKYRRILKQHPNIKVIEPEAIFDGVLRQELRFSKHYLV